LLQGLSKNRSFLLIMLVCGLVQVLLITFGGTLFRTQPMDSTAFLQILLLAATVIPFDLLRKALLKA